MAPCGRADLDRLPAAAFDSPIIVPPSTTAPGTSCKRPPGTELDHGAIGRRVRAGRTIRTPNFRWQGKVHYLVSGGAMVYAAVDGHTLIAGPLHGQLLMDFPSSPMASAG